MKKQFWRWMIVITVSSFVATLLLGSDIPWYDLGRTCFSWPHTKEILYDISVGVFSSMILIWCIDRIQARSEERQEAQKRLILYKKLAPIFTKYYNFYLFLFIATRNKPVESTSNVRNSLYSCKDELIKQINNTDPFYKDGYYGDPIKLNAQMSLIRNDPTNPQIVNMSTSLPWYKCWCIEGTEFHNSISRIERDFPTFFSNELLEFLEELLALVEPQKNMVHFVEGTMIPIWVKEQFQMSQFPQLPTDFFLDTYKLSEVLLSLDKTMELIERDSKLHLRQRELAFFNDRNVTPVIGHSCKTQA